MKLVEQFRSFLTDTVNLNQTRLNLLDSSVEAVENAVRASDWGPTIIEFLPQGSWAHQTIIKPLEGAAFDADLVIFVKPKDGWESKQYVNELYRALTAETSAYKDKARRYSHCVTIEYAGERKIDLTPCVRDRQWIGVDEVCNRDSNQFEASKPGEYTKWVIERNAIGGSNSFRKATRLLKYLRVFKTTFTCPSFLLTTLLGNQVYGSDKDSENFGDPATTLKTLMGRLDDWLQARPTLPEVRNPVMYSEVQSRVWDDTKYQTFRDRINLYRGWIDDAYNEADRSESIGKWRRLFGDDFAAGEVIEKAERISEVALASHSGTIDLVDVLKARGAVAIPADYLKLPHIERPKWRLATGIQVTPIIHATLTASNGTQLHSTQSLDALRPGYGIDFSALQSNGLPLPADYEVQWRVTNTGRAARAERALRGDFYRSAAGNTRHESLKYRGLHMVEAFVIRRRDERLVGKSAPHFVLIE